MLVHICCSVDSHYFLQELREFYPQEYLVGFFYNPNIHPKSEYDLRLNDVKRSCRMLGIHLLDSEVYDDERWLEEVRGLEYEPEKGRRCVKCFDIRLEMSAYKAKQIGEKKFTTTLLASPMKEQEVLYDQGDKIGLLYGLKFIKINARSNGGAQKQNELAKKDNLYRQNYCGCRFALAQQRDKQNRLSLEMISEIGGRKLPGSIEHRQEVFAKRDRLEQNQKNYILIQRKKIIWRVLNSKIISNDNNIFNYILPHSESKNYKIKNIIWQEILIKNLANEVQKISIGFSKKDDSLFLTLDTFNALTKREYKHILEVIHSPINYDEELILRQILCGNESINPIIIIQDRISEDIQIHILAIFQEEKIFDIIECY